MQRIIARIALVSWLGVAAVCSAQTATHPIADPQRVLQHLSKKLALTGDQQNQILPVLTDRKSSIESIEQDASLSAKQRAAKIRAVRVDTQSKIRLILTDNQRAAFDQMEQEARARAKTRRQAGSAVSN